MVISRVFKILANEIKILLKNSGFWLQYSVMVCLLRGLLFTGSCTRRAWFGVCCVPRSDRHNARIHILGTHIFHDVADAWTGQLGKYSLSFQSCCLLLQLSVPE